MNVFNKVKDPKKEEVITPQSYFDFKEYDIEDEIAELDEEKNRIMNEM